MANSKRRCKQCREYHPVESSVKTPAGWFCSREHAAEFALQKIRAASDKKRKQQHQKAKMDVKPIGYWMKRAQAAVNKYVRLRDKDEPCISCGRMHQGQWHAGHYLSVGSRPNLRFDAERNIFKQCQPCNVHLSGNLLNYRVGLIERIGSDAVESLESDTEPRRYRKEDLVGIERHFNDLIKSME